MSPRVVWIGLLLEIPATQRYEGSRLHIAKHDVSWQEVEEVCLFGHADVSKWVKDRSTGQRTLHVYGRTVGGRPLFCVLKPNTLEADTFLVITAYEQEAP